jgi:very-short-patch-repair endonuclease
VEGGKNQLKNEGMHAGAKADKFAFARVLRDTETPQEKKLWDFLRSKPKGCKFRRQHPFKYFILDFYCHQAKLVIEIDGCQHKSNVEYDRDRSKIIQEYGLKVIRFENIEIDERFGEVTRKLMDFL